MNVARLGMFTTSSFHGLSSRTQRKHSRRTNDSHFREPRQAGNLVRQHVLVTDAVQFLSQALYVVLFGVALGQAVRRPGRAAFEIALFFGAAALAVVLGLLEAALHIDQPPPLLTVVSASLIMVLPYLLLRLAGSFSEVRAGYQYAAAAGLALLVGGLVVVPQPYPVAFVLVLVACFVIVSVGASMVFIRQAGRSPGVTRRRLQCVAWGSAVLGLDILVAGLGALLPSAAGVWTVIGGLLGLASGVLYFVGFAPPTWLRRAWQEPAMRAFLGRGTQLLGEADPLSTIRELEDRTAMVLGAPASVGLWIEAEGVLRFYVRQTELHPRSPSSQGEYNLQPERGVFDLKPGHMIAGRAFVAERPIFMSDTAREDPSFAPYYRATGSQAAMAAPITAGTHRLGVLTAYAARAPIFADSDLELMQVLADEAAIVLESRALIEESAKLRAREEADRLKDDFLASISHDLRNPLTAVRGVTQVLERRIERDSKIDPERLGAALNNIRDSTTQMAGLIDQLLDYARLQMNRPLELKLAPTDLVTLTRRTIESYADASERHHIRFEAATEVIIGDWDAARLERVVQNLVGNAVKYSPQGGDVLVRAVVERSDGRVWGVVTVEDHGVGIPAEDLPHVFERFHRAANVADMPGTGLGLAAARQVIEQHGGSISVSSELGRGSRFEVRLPLNEREPPRPTDPPPGANPERRPTPTDLHVALEGGLP
jgi:signal transduction histidine kinase